MFEIKSIKSLFNQKQQSKNNGRNCFCIGDLEFSADPSLLGRVFRSSPGKHRRSRRQSSHYTRTPEQPSNYCLKISLHNSRKIYIFHQRYHYKVYKQYSFCLFSKNRALKKPKSDLTRRIIRLFYNLGLC